MTQPPAGHDPYQYDPYRSPDGPPQGGAPDSYGQPPAPGGYEPQQQPYGSQDPYGQQPYPSQGQYGSQQQPQQPYGSPQGYGTQQQYDPYGSTGAAQQSPYGYAAYTAPTSTTNALAITGFVLALIGVLGCWIPGVNIVTALLAVAGLVLGIVGLAQVKKGKSGKGFAISAIIIAVIAVLGTILTWVLLAVWANSVSDNYEAATGGASDEIVANDLGVEYGAFEAVEEFEGYYETSLPVTVTNNSDESSSFDFDVQALDANGELIESDFVYTDTLSPGQSQTFQIFEFVDADNVEAMQSATFEVVDASKY
ncbi:DUF4190 and DUF4352 domain-containing protein [Cellulosimicrobium terreum]|nr:DUF4190 and DUF4352 domain-containing protein [Cellulosimicrobium terreum]